jgi:hypothetical protein
MLKPMMGPLSDFGSGWSGIAVWTLPSGGGGECIGIRVWMEVGSGSPGGRWVVVDVSVCDGFDDDDGDDDDESRWRFTKRWYWSWDAA